MTTWLTRCFAGLLLGLPFMPAVAGDPDDKEIARLVKQLGSSDFRTREAARKELEAIGEPETPCARLPVLTLRPNGVPHRSSSRSTPSCKSSAMRDTPRGSRS